MIELVIATAERLEELAAEQGLARVNERDHLQKVFEQAARELAPHWNPPASVSKDQATSPLWPALGAVDLVITWDEQRVLIELKAGSPLDACAWDILKCTFILVSGRASSAYLVAAADSRSWRQACPGSEFFLTGEWDAAELRETYAVSFKKWERDGYPVAMRVPRRMSAFPVVSAPFSVARDPWELRAARIARVSDDWFDWPPLLSQQLAP